MSLAEALAGGRERSLRAGGLAHHVIEWGEPDAREVVLLCHGFLDLAWGFLALSTRLVREGRRVVAFDWRGHGESEWIGKGGYYHFVDYLLDLHELLPQLSDEPVHLVGHSMGGTACTLFAATHPDRIRTLTLLEGWGPPGEDVSKAPERIKTWLAGVDAVRREGAPAKLRDVAHARERLHARNPDLDPALLDVLAEKSTCPHPNGSGRAWRFDPLHRTLSPTGFDLARFSQFTKLVHAPTLLVQGERGLRTGDDESRMASYPNAQRAVVAGAGHMMHWTHPSETAALLATHFAGT